MMHARVIVVSCLLLAFVLARPALADDAPTLAVYPAMHGPAAPDPAKFGFDAQEVTRRLEEAVRATARFRLFERNRQLQAAVLEEQDFAKSDRALGNAAEFGKLYNVALIVQPFISDLRFGAAFADVDGLPGKHSRTDSGRLVVVFKVLDTTSGELKFQVTTDAGFSYPARILDAKTGGPGPESWIKMVDDVCRQGANAIVNNIWPIKVVKYEQHQVFVNRGEGGGLKVGELWGLFSAGEILRDPDTGKNLGSAEFPIGRVKVVRVAPGFGVVEPVGELKQVPKPGDILHKE